MILFMSSNGLSPPPLPLSLIPVPGFIDDGPAPDPAFIILLQMSRSAYNN